jgi:hypothetical protein
MPSIIRISGPDDWGTTFCVQIGEDLRYYTAAHVLEHCGVRVGASSALLDMCDQFQTSARSFNLTDVVWDKGCDFATFSSDFLGKPFALCGCPNPATIVSLHGYLVQSSKTMPNCGVWTTLDGSILANGNGNGCQKMRSSLGLRAMVTNLNGMSGGPVVDVSTGKVFALLNGAPSLGGGPPFVATVL